jgi:hypothetical protein
MELSLVTVEEYRQLPDREDVIEELHFGMIVTLPWPKMGAFRLQSRFERLLHPKQSVLALLEPRSLSAPFPSTNCAAPMWLSSRASAGTPPTMTTTSTARRSW